MFLVVPFLIIAAIVGLAFLVAGAFLQLSQALAAGDASMDTPSKWDY